MPSSTVRDTDVRCTKYVLVVKHSPREDVMCTLGMIALEGYISCRGKCFIPLQLLVFLINQLEALVATQCYH